MQKLGELDDCNAPSRGRSGHRGEVQPELGELPRQQLAAGHRSQQAAGNLCSALHRNLAMDGGNGWGKMWDRTGGEFFFHHFRLSGRLCPRFPFKTWTALGHLQRLPLPSLLRRPIARRSSWPETSESPRQGICSWKLTFLVPWCTAMPAGCHRWQIGFGMVCAWVRVLGLQWGYGQPIPSSLAAAQDCRS